MVLPALPNIFILITCNCVLINKRNMPSDTQCKLYAEVDMPGLYIYNEMVLLQEMSSMEAIEEQKAQEDGEPSVATEKEGR